MSEVLLDGVPPASSDVASASVAVRLLEQADRTPDAPFLVFDGADRPEVHSYAETVELAGRGRAVLESVGIGRGDRFAIATTNRREFMACWFGAALAGSVMVPISPKSSPDELRYVVEHADCQAVVLEPDDARLAEAAQTAGVAIVVCGDDFDGRARGRLDLVPSAVDPLSPLSIMYTSGTTSRPKGVMVSHANYLFAGEAVAQHLRMRPEDRWLVALPLFHANAQYYSTMSALVTGASLVVASRFSASGWGRQVREHGVTLGSLFAAPVRMILNQEPSARDAENVLRAVIFAQNLTSLELAQFEERFATPLLQIYGMTETIAPPLMNPLFGRRDNSTVGRPGLASRVRVVDEDGRDVRPGDVGQLLVHGEPGRTLMAGYLDAPEVTARAVRSNWLHTGDLVVQRPDGFVAFHDRAGDVIKRAGENIAAAEIERVVDEHPDVMESAAIGVPDPVRDEAVKIVVVRRPSSTLTEDELLEHCRGTLATFKVPSYVEFTGPLPRTSVGKIRKNLLKP